MFCVTKLACSAVQSVRQSRNNPLAAPEVRYMQGGSDHQRGLLLSACHNRHRQPLQFKRNMCSDSGFLDRKNVIFVGGLGSIGMATSREICKAGPKNLIVLDKIENDDAIEELGDVNVKTKVAYYNYDVTGSVGTTCKLLKKIFNKFKAIDLLINGAGMLDDHQIETTIAVNFTGLVNTTTALMPFWDKRNGGPGGVVANICSVTGMNPIHQVPVYSATTAAAFSFTNSLAKLEKITGVSAFSINLGITKTTLVENINSWLDVEPNVAELLLENSTQTTKQCAKKLVEAIQQNMNGAIWKLDLGRLSMVDWPIYWSSHI